MLVTIEEACQILDPPLQPNQLKAILAALRWQPGGWQHTGQPGRPKAAYQWNDISALHEALLPFLSISDA